MGIEEDLQKALEGKKKEETQLSTVLTRIANGESTGDKIKDLLLVYHNGRVDAEIEQRYRAFQQEVNSHIGELVLVKYVHSEQTSPDGCFGWPTFDNVTYFLQMGIIGGELTFDFPKTENDFTSLIFPMEKHISKGDDFWRYSCLDRPWQETVGAISILAYHFERSEMTFFRDHGKERKMDVIIGEEDITLYFAVGEHGFENVRETRRAYERIENAREREEALERHRYIIDQLYASRNRVRPDHKQALDLLGLTIPEKQQQQHDQQIAKQKEEVLNTILEGAVAQNLEKALSLGLHTEPRTIEREAGVTIDVPRYIVGLCEKYKVKIK